jgi:hypothetical protein
MEGIALLAFIVFIVLACAPDRSQAAHESQIAAPVRVRRRGGK